MTLEADAELPSFGGDDEDLTPFLTNLTGTPEAAKEAPEAAAEGVEQETVEGGTEAEPAAAPATEGEAAQPAEGEGDDPAIEFKIGDTARSLKHSELRALVEKQDAIAARETQTQQAEQAVQTERMRAQAALQKSIERANARLEPYKDLNLFLLAKQMPDAEFSQLTKDMQEAASDVQFFQQELDTFVRQENQRLAQTAQDNNARALAAIQNPKDPRHIPNFDAALVGKMVDFAVAAGVDRNVAMGISDPGVIKLIHQAMQQAQGAAKTTSAITRVGSKTTKQLTPGAARSSGGATTSRNDAVAAMRRAGGSEDAAFEAFRISLKTP